MERRSAIRAGAFLVGGEHPVAAMDRSAIRKGMMMHGGPCPVTRMDLGRGEIRSGPPLISPAQPLSEIGLRLTAVREALDAIRAAATKDRER